MNVGELLKTAAGVLGTVHPGIAGAISLANIFLDDEDKLPLEATGKEVEDKVQSLPPDVRATILNKKVDLDIAREEGWTERYKAMCAAEGQETRAKAVMRVTNVLCFEIVAFTVLLFWKPELAESPVVWTAFGTLTGVPASVLLSYFGNLRKEQAARQDTIRGSSTRGAVENVIRAWKG